MTGAYVNRAALLNVAAQADNSAADVAALDCATVADDGLLQVIKGHGKLLKGAAGYQAGQGSIDRQPAIKLKQLSQRRQQAKKPQTPCAACTMVYQGSLVLLQVQRSCAP